MLLPGESKTVTIETSVRDIPAGGRFVLSGWNVESKDIKIYCYQRVLAENSNALSHSAGFCEVIWNSSTPPSMMSS